MEIPNFEEVSEPNRDWQATHFAGSYIDEISSFIHWQGVERLTHLGVAETVSGDLDKVGDVLNQTLARKPEYGAAMTELGRLAAIKSLLSISQ